MHFGRFYTHIKLVLCKTEPESLRDLLARIGVGRQMVRLTSRFVETLLGNLASDERQAYDAVHHEIELIRQAAEEDEELSDFLAPALKYFYGPAQRAAETSKKNQALIKTAQEETEKRLKLASSPENKGSLGADLSAFMDVLRRLLPSTDDRATSR